jgi:hypothetical protein
LEVRKIEDGSKTQEMNGVLKGGFDVWGPIKNTLIGDYMEMMCHLIKLETQFLTKNDTTHKFFKVSGSVG